MRAALAFALYLVLATLLLLEVGVRLWGYSGRFLYDPIYMRFQGSDEIPFVHKPNLANARAHGYSIANTDALGLRSVEPGTRYGPKQPGEFRVAVAGDSVTFGVGVIHAEDTYCEVLERLLEKARPDLRVEVLNYGVGSYSVREMEATLRHRMFDVEPDVVVMAAIYADFNLARTPGVDDWGYFNNARLSGSQNSWLKRLLRGVHLSYLIRDLRYGLRMRGVTPPVGVPESYSYVLAFRDVAARHGVPSLFVLLPSTPVPAPSLEENVALVDARLRQDGVPFVDLFGLRDEFALEDYRASRFDDHPSAPVHRRIAEELAKTFESRGLLPEARSGRR